MSNPTPSRSKPVPPDARASDFARFLKSCHLDGKTVVTIARFTIEETHPKPNISEQGLVVHFVEPLPPFVLSPTNRNLLTELFGNPIAGWVGKRIELYVQVMRVGNVEKRLIRVRPAPPSEPATRPAAQPTPQPVSAPAPLDDFTAGLTDPAPQAEPRPAPAESSDKVTPTQRPAPLANGSHPGWKEWKAFCDQRNLPVPARNELLRKHLGSYEDAIAELSAQTPVASATGK